MSNISKSIIMVLIVIVVAGCGMWSGTINKMMPSNSRPTEVTFPVKPVSEQELTQIANQLKSDFGQSFDHVERFRQAGMLAYEGPQTCLTCHEKIEVTDASSGKTKTVDLMRNLTTSVHYRFYSTKHPEVYGFNGKLADNFRMGKINRPCPKPGPFAIGSVS